jgi:hypothetical protein
LWSPPLCACRRAFDRPRRPGVRRNIAASGSTENMACDSDPRWTLGSQSPVSRTYRRHIRTGD